MGVINIELKSNSVSIDMIELAMNIEPLDFQKHVIPYLKHFELSINLKYWDSFKWDRYRHNWLWDTGDYSIFLAYKNNLSKGEASNKFKIKYNPNKVNKEDPFLKVMLNVFKYVKEFPVITWFDVAFDYEGITTSDLIFDKGRKREYKIFKYLDSDFTYYLGKSGTNGSVKIYDKANEEKKGQADYNKTRYEVTIRDTIGLKDINAWKCKVDIPKLYIKQIKGLYDDEELTPTERLLVYSIENDYPMEKLTFRQRQRYKKIAESKQEQYTTITPSQLDIERAIQQFTAQLLS